jgi:hypothetical protein
MKKTLTLLGVTVGLFSAAPLLQAQTGGAVDIINWDITLPTVDLTAGASNAVVFVTVSGVGSTLDLGNGAPVLLSVTANQDGNGKIYGYAEITGTGGSNVTAVVIYTATNGIQDLVLSNFVVMDTNGTTVTNFSTVLRSNFTAIAISNAPTNAVTFETNLTAIFDMVVTNSSTTNAGGTFVTNITTETITNVSVVTASTNSIGGGSIADLFGPVTGQVSGQAGKQKVSLSIKARGHAAGDVTKPASANVSLSGTVTDGTLLLKGKGSLAIKGQKTQSGSLTDIDLGDLATIGGATIDGNLLATGGSVNADATKAKLSLTGRNIATIGTLSDLGGTGLTLLGGGSGSVNNVNPDKAVASLNASFKGIGQAKGSSVKWNLKSNAAATEPVSGKINGKLSGQSFSVNAADLGISPADIIGGILTPVTTP